MIRAASSRIRWLVAFLLVFVLSAVLICGCRDEQRPASASPDDSRPQSVAADNTASGIVPRLQQQSVISDGKELMPKEIPVSLAGSGKTYPDFGVDHTVHVRQC